MQNGTWYGDHKKVEDTEVDTEALAHIIAENDNVEEALKKVQAAYSLCWFNTTTSTLNLIRNAARPLWLAETMSGSLIWASEGTFIQLAAMRSNVTLKDKPVMLEEHSLVSLTLKNNSWERKQVKVHPFRQVEYSWPDEVEMWRSLDGQGDRGGR